MSGGTYLVTGGTGEIGTALVKLLRREGVAVRAMVRSPGGERARGLAGVGAEVVKGDLTDRGSLNEACRGVAGVYHLGALYREAGLAESVYFDVNAEGTRRMFEAAVAAGVERVVHCSTGGVLGDVKDPPGSDTSPYAPGDSYQRSKTEGEKIALEFYRSGTMRGVVIRPAMVYGPGDTRHLKLFRMIARGKFFYIGRGDKSVHFIHIEDLARSFKMAMDRTDLNAEVYHIAGQEPMTLREAVEVIADELGVKRPTRRLPVRPVQWAGSVCELICAPVGIRPPLYRRRVDFFTKSRHFDTSKAERELGFRASRPSREEVAEVARGFRGEGVL